MKVKCPTCGKELEWSKDNQYRPFCSSRCKLIDLGAWLDEKMVISRDESDAGDAAVSVYDVLESNDQKKAVSEDLNSNNNAK